MFDVREPLTKDAVYSKIDSLNIIRKYSKNFTELNKMFCSDFRDESKPSCHVIFHKGDYLVKDFGGESMRPLSFVMRILGLNYPEALSRINNDLALNFVDISQSGHQVRRDIKPCENTPSIVKIKRREWNDDDIDFWSQYGWRKGWLKECDISPISHYSLNGIIRIAERYAYSVDYYWHEGVFRRKIYQPFSRDYKWYSNVNKTVVQGYKMLPKEGGIVVITKAIKDIAPFYQIGIPAIATNNETTFLPKEYMEKLTQRFKRLIVWFDNDECGLRFGKRYADEWGIESYHTPIGEAKDPSDFYKLNGFNKWKELVDDIFFK